MSEFSSHKKRLLPFGIALVLAALLYYPVTNAMIDYCVNDLKTPSATCLYLFWHSGDEASFLIQMGSRSVPPIQRTLDRTGVPLKQRIFFAWILSKIGDHSRFPVFIEGLASEKRDIQALAAMRMRNFPGECLNHLSEIVAAPSQQAYDAYWWLLMDMAKAAKLDPERQDNLWNLLFSHSRNSSLTATEQREILALFGKERYENLSPPDA